MTFIGDTEVEMDNQDNKEKLQKQIKAYISEILFNNGQG